MRRNLAVQPEYKKKSVSTYLLFRLFIFLSCLQLMQPDYVIFLALPVVQRSARKGCFSIRHQAGLSCVEYEGSGWLAFAHYNSNISSVLEVLQDSKK